MINEARQHDLLLLGLALITEFDLVPCPLLVSDSQGGVLQVNNNFLTVLGGDRSSWLDRPMDALFPLASRIFLQTHVWPMLLREGEVKELRLQIWNAAKQSLPVLVNCQRTTRDGVNTYHWLFFISHQRTQYEAELLAARKRADLMAQHHQQSERFLRAVTNAVPSLIAYWDRDLRCQFFNQGYLDWCGKQPAEMQGASIGTVLGEDLFARNEPHIQTALQAVSQEFEREFTKSDGTLGSTWAQYIPDVDASGVVLGFYEVGTDVTRIKDADAAIRLSASVFNATTEGILVTDTAGVLLSVNPAFCVITGYAAPEVLGHNLRTLKWGGHGADFHAELWSTLVRCGQWRGELWCTRKDGGVYLEDLSVTSIRDVNGQVLRYVGVFSDISERNKRDEQIRHMAQHDALTDLPNRSLMMERLNQQLELSVREPRPLGVLFLDLDGFKAVNDQLGHDTGDLVLKTVAQRLKGLLRTTDTVARLGGDEFVILLHHPEGYEAIIQIAERVIAVINSPIVAGERVAKVGTSIGIAVHPEHGTNADRLLMRADHAMYQAKRSGKNTFRFSE